MNLNRFGVGLGILLKQFRNKKLLFNNKPSLKTNNICQKCRDTMTSSYYWIMRLEKICNVTLRRKSCVSKINFDPLVSLYMHYSIVQDKLDKNRFILKPQPVFGPPILSSRGQTRFTYCDGCTKH